MTRYETNRGVTVFHAGRADFAVPQGTELLRIDVPCSQYAVRSESLISQLSNDPHAAKHYWAWVPKDAVREVQ